MHVSSVGWWGSKHGYKSIKVDNEAIKLKDPNRGDCISLVLAK